MCGLPALFVFIYLHVGNVLVFWGRCSLSFLLYTVDHVFFLSPVDRHLVSAFAVRSSVFVNILVPLLT